MLRGSVYPATGANVQWNGRGSRRGPANPNPALDTVVNILSASNQVLPGGNYRCTVGYDSSVRFNFKLADLRGGQQYRLTFTVVSIVGEAACLDWCDGDEGPAPSVPAGVVPLVVGPMSIVVSRPYYDATFRFLDIANASTDEDEAGASTIEITKPMLEAI